MATDTVSAQHYYDTVLSENYYDSSNATTNTPTPERIYDSGHQSGDGYGLGDRYDTSSGSNSVLSSPWLLWAPITGMLLMVCLQLLYNFNRQRMSSDAGEVEGTAAAAQLRSYDFRALARDNELKPSQESCVVCMETLRGCTIGSGNPAVWLACGHVFHRTCAIEWFERCATTSTATTTTAVIVEGSDCRSTCPTCRSPVVTVQQQQP